ncbi:BMP family ABC transporter substrate-binding protein [Mesorhizobium sp. B2-3-11]|nr:BMP family protein [Mesorhizobium sp. B2-3-11]TPM07058.1 BMP family ABC transporter substrate-binding protein [Mesorhizobium sp. B2-3-11]
MKKTAISRRSLLASALGLTLAGTIWSGLARAQDFKMGLLVTGSVAEEGWNRIAYEALKRVEKELGAKISYVELQQNPASFEKAFRDYASQGYQVILGHGFEFQDSAQTVAEEYPDTVFLISSSNVHDGKVIGLNTDSSQPFYLMGAIAAKMGKAAGLIGGMEIPPIKEALEGFVNGAKDASADFKVSQVYLGNFTDATAAKEAAINMIHGGADFVVPDADAAGLGTIQAVREAGPEISTFSIFSDQTEIAPKNILGTYIADYGQGVVRIVKGIKEGTVPTSNVDFGLKDTDVVKFSYNDKAAHPVSEDVRKYVEDVKAKIIAGEIKTRHRQ